MIRGSKIGKSPWPSIAAKSTSIPTAHEPLHSGHRHTDAARGGSSGCWATLSSTAARGCSDHRPERRGAVVGLVLSGPKSQTPGTARMGLSPTNGHGELPRASADSHV